MKCFQSGHGLGYTVPPTSLKMHHAPPPFDIIPVQSELCGQSFVVLRANRPPGLHVGLTSDQSDVREGDMTVRGTPAMQGSSGGLGCSLHSVQPH